MKIVTKHVKINHEPFKNINLNGATNFFDDIKNIDLDLMIINKKHVKDSNVVASYEIRYITKWDHTYQKIPACLRFTDVDAYFTYFDKYLVFTLTENNKEEVVNPYKKL